jgi:type IV pilus assembly protein PilZ
MHGPGVVSVSIKDLAALNAAYMPFIIGGGLFIPTDKTYSIGSELFLLLHIIDNVEPLAVAAKVVWITPARATGQRVSGIGLQFNDPVDNARKHIENTLLESQGTQEPARYTL